jgi:signal transduction histidine kinase
VRVSGPKSEAVSLEGFYKRFLKYSFVVALMSGFLPSGIVLVAAFPEVGITSVLVFLSALGIALLGWLPKLHWERSWTIIAGLAWMTTYCFVFPLPAGGPWLVSIGVVIAVCFLAIVDIPLKQALPVILGCAVFTWVSTTFAADRLQIPTSGFPFNFMSTSYVLAAGLGLSFAMEYLWRTALRLDAEGIDLRMQQESLKREIAISEARAAVHRRIHETVLNTLALIALGVEKSAVPRVRRDCELQFAELLSPIPRLRGQRLVEILNDAVSGVIATGLVCHLDVRASQDLPDATVLVIRDAVVELLRNVQRHSGTSEAWIVVRNEDALVIEVTDRGRGLPPEAKHRFGLQETVVDAIEAHGGEVIFRSSSPRGLTVCLTLPIPHDEETQEHDLSTRKLSDLVPAARFGLAFTSLGVVFVSLGGFIAGWYGPATLVIALAMSLMSFSLARQWGSPHMWVWGVILMSLLIGMLVVINVQVETCNQAYGGQWVLRTVAIASFLPILAFRKTWSRVLAALTVGLAVWIPAAAFSRTCGPALILQAVVILVILGMIVGALMWFSNRFAERQREDSKAWRQLVDDRTKRAAWRLESSSWNQIGQSTRDLLNEIARGDIDLRSDVTRKRAELEAQSIRARIVGGRRPLEDYRGPLALLSTELRKRGISVDIRDQDVVKMELEIPPSALDWILSLADELEPATVRIRRMSINDVPELVISLEAVSIPDEHSEAAYSESEGYVIHIDVEHLPGVRRDRMVISMIGESSQLDTHGLR